MIIEYLESKSNFSNIFQFQSQKVNILAKRTFKT